MKKTSAHGPLGPGIEVHRHWIKFAMCRRAIRIRLRRQYKPSPNRVLLNIPDSIPEFVLAKNLALVKTTHPHIQLAFVPKRETTFDELHSLFERNIGSRCDDDMEMIRHDDKCVQQKLALGPIIEDCPLQKLCIGRDLKESMALRSDRSDEIGSDFLRCAAHGRKDK